MAKKTSKGRVYLGKLEIHCLLASQTATHGWLCMGFPYCLFLFLELKTK
jgi:hypothetical protein